MNFLEATKLIQQHKTVHRACWNNGGNCTGVQVSLDKSEFGIVKYHVAACEIHLTIEDILADDWVEGANY